MRKLFYILMVISFASCQDFFLQEVDVKIDKYPKGVAVTAIWVNAQEGGKIFISEANPILDSTPQVITNAEIKVSSTKGSVWGISTIDSDGAFDCIPNNSVTIGDKLSLQIKVANFPELTASQIVPDTVSLKTFEFILNGFSNPDGYKENLYKINLDDPIGKNYYGVKIVQLDEQGNESRLYLSSSDQYYKGESDSQVHLFNDHLFNGKNITLNLHGSNWNGNEGKIIIYLYNLSEDLYRYFYAEGIKGEDEENPFQEPVVIPQNIANGYGIFGIASCTKKIVEL